MGVCISIGNCYVEKPDGNLFKSKYTLAIENFDSEKINFIDGECDSSYKSNINLSCWGKLLRDSDLVDWWENIIENEADHQLTHEDVGLMNLAIKNFKARYPNAKPGYPGVDGDYEDYPLENSLLSRLIWLQKWVTWTVKNCKSPAIHIA